MFLLGPGGVVHADFASCVSLIKRKQMAELKTIALA